MIFGEVEFLDACGGQIHKVAKALAVSPEVAARDSSTIVCSRFIDEKKQTDRFILRMILRGRLIFEVE